MNRLPSELLSLICTFINDHKDISNVRLTCKALALTGAGSLSPVASFCFLPQSVSRLVAKSQHPVIQHNVTSLVCYLGFLNEYNDYEEWKWKATVHSRRRLFRQLSDEEYQEGWAAYQEHYRNQNEIFRSEGIITTLTEIFKRFTNLRTLEIKPFKRDSNRNIIGKCIEDYIKCLVHLRCRRESNVRAVGILLQASATANARIRCLLGTKVNCRAFDSSFQDKGLQEAGRSATTLKDIRMNLRCSRLDVFSDAVQGLRVYLSCATLIETLHLQFDTFSRGNYCPIFDDVVSADQSWPRLQSLLLEGMQFTLEPFVKFLFGHSSTLRYFHLKDCDLSSNERIRWVALFTQIMDHLTLKDLDLKGSLWLDRREFVYIHSGDEIKDLDTTIGEVLRAVVCKSDTGACAAMDEQSMRRDIISDLFDAQTPRSLSIPPRRVALAVRHVDYLRRLIPSS